MERIFIVDDDPGACRMLERHFKLKDRFEVYIARDGETALERFKDIDPHIVLLDIRMPGMGGIATLKKIKSINPNTGVIMTTALADEDLAKAAIYLGAYEYITKPIDLDYLDTVIMVKTVDFWD